ncbi:MAG: TSUP family transporter [Rhodobacteraceae bacterium]|nr:TSUP family transporter [Paracoccaceae bacterium]
MPDFATLLPMIVLLVVIGGLAGVLAGLLGVGGGIVLVPAFFYAFGSLGFGGPHLMQVCVATSLATIMVTSGRSVLAHNRKGAVDWGILKGFGPGIVVGSLLGSIAVSHLHTLTLQIIFGCLALVVSLYLGLGRVEWRLGDAMPTGALRLAISPLVGFLSVLMGIGGGSFGVPLMTLFSTPIHRAVATAAGFGMLIAVPSVITFLFSGIPDAPPYTLGLINIPAFLLIIAMTLTTTPWGVKLAHAMDPKPLRRVFAVFLGIVALNMLRKAAGW